MFLLCQHLVDNLMLFSEAGCLDHMMRWYRYTFLKHHHHFIELALFKGRMGRCVRDHHVISAYSYIIEYPACFIHLVNCDIFLKISSLRINNPKNTLLCVKILHQLQNLSGRKPACQCKVVHRAASLHLPGKLF